MTGAAVTPMAPLAAGTTLRVVDDEQFAAVAAEMILAQLQRTPAGTLGVATGRTPEAVYEALAASTHGVDLRALHLAALDEYVGIAPDDPRSYRSYVLERVAGPLGVPAARVLLPWVSIARSVDYDQQLEAIGGVDLQIAGIGRNGHLGFNEPGSPLDSRSRVVELMASTRHDNAAYFGGDPEAVPTHAVTQGLGTILAARQVLLLARGESKRAALVAALSGPVSSELPASVLQRHSHVTVIADRAAAGALAP